MLCNCFILFTNHANNQSDNEVGPIPILTAPTNSQRCFMCRTPMRRRRRNPDERFYPLSYWQSQMSKMENQRKCCRECDRKPLDMFVLICQVVGTSVLTVFPGSQRLTRWSDPRPQDLVCIYFCLWAFAMCFIWFSFLEILTLMLSTRL